MKDSVLELRDNLLTYFAVISSFAPVVWPLSKARWILRSSFESLRNVLLGKKRDCEAAASLNPCSQLSSYEVILGVKIYTTGILSCILETSQIGQEYSRETLYPGVEVP